jgi:hypothetical protein
LKTNYKTSSYLGEHFLSCHVLQGFVEISGMQHWWRASWKTQESWRTVISEVNEHMVVLTAWMITLEGVEQQRQRQH